MARLRTVQRKMLRMILNARRRTLATTSECNSDTTDENDRESSEAVDLEPWHEFLQRTAQWVEESLDSGMAQEEMEMGCETNGSGQ